MVAAYVLLDYQTTPINDSAFELANACSLDQSHCAAPSAHVYLLCGTVAT